jgi:hypothetical protein
MTERMDTPPSHNPFMLQVLLKPWLSLFFAAWVAVGAIGVAGCAGEPAKAPPLRPSPVAVEVPPPSPPPVTAHVAIAPQVEPATEAAIQPAATAATTTTTTTPTTEAATEPTTEPTTQASTAPTTQRSTNPAIARTRPDYWWRQPALFTIEANDFDTLWRACEASARHFGFVLDRLDYRGGMITTQPLTSKQFWELWRNDVATLEDVANSSLSTYRRTIRFEIDKTEDGSRYIASPRVVIERYARSETPIVASILLRNAFRSQRGSRTWGTRETDRGINLPRTYWYATGRDEALEKNVASEMRKQLARAQRDHQ